MARFFVGLLTGVLVTLLAAVLVPVVGLATGILDVGASSGAWPLEEAIAPRLRNLAVAAQAPDRINPRAGDPAAISSGMADYLEDCVLCHPIPGVAEAEYQAGLYPTPPTLDGPATQNRTDGELFWIVENGIRMTGMPAFGGHGEDEIWEIVAFLRELPRMKEGGPEKGDAPDEEGSEEGEDGG